MTAAHQPGGLQRRDFVRWLAGGALAGSVGGLPLARAAAYPAAPISLIVPWPPGGPNDVVMRAMAASAAKTLGQSVVIVNRPGAGGTLGASTMAASARPDGYTIVQYMVSVLRLPFIEKVSYDPLKDFSFIVGLGGSSTGIVVLADSPLHKLQDLVALAKAKPGTVSYATTGQGTTLHLAMEAMSRSLGIQLLHVPYRGTADTTVALMSGQVMMQLDVVGLPAVRAGKARVLATFNEVRDPKVPDSPTLKELGVNVVASSPYGLAGPKGMDPAVMLALQDAFHAALDAPEVRSVIADNGQLPWYRNSDEFHRWAEQQQAIEGQNVRAAGLALTS